jgi:hypothetical protein
MQAALYTIKWNTTHAVDRIGDSGSSSWTRHTRVYGGGGVCLACATVEGGGFYGARVRPEDKR